MPSAQTNAAIDDPSGLPLVISNSHPELTGHRLAIAEAYLRDEAEHLTALLAELELPADRQQAIEQMAHDLVAAVPPGTINHKQVQKARKGRRLTPNMQEKIAGALNACLAPESYEFRDIFNYRGKKQL